MAERCGPNLTLAAEPCSASPCNRRPRQALPMPDNRIVHIVDDDEAVRQSRAFLWASTGLAVRVYDSATSFLAGLASVKGGCLITDMRMPDMTGLELLHQLRAKAFGPPAHVITRP